MSFLIIILYIKQFLMPKIKILQFKIPQRFHDNHIAYMTMKPLKFQVTLAWNKILKDISKSSMYLMYLRKKNTFLPKKSCLNLYTQKTTWYKDKIILKTIKVKIKSWKNHFELEWNWNGVINKRRWMDGMNVL